MRLSVPNITLDGGHSKCQRERCDQPAAGAFLLRDFQSIRCAVRCTEHRAGFPISDAEWHDAAPWIRWSKDGRPVSDPPSHTD